MDQTCYRGIYKRSLSEILVQVLSVVGVLHRHIPAYFAQVHKPHQVAVERMHSHCRSGLHHRAHLMAFSLADQVQRRVGADQDLRSRASSLAVGRGKQALGNHSLQDAGQLGPGWL